MLDLCWGMADLLLKEILSNEGKMLMRPIKNVLAFELIYVINRNLFKGVAI